MKIYEHKSTISFQLSSSENNMHESEPEAKTKSKNSRQDFVIYNLKQLDENSITRKLTEIPVSDDIKELIRRRSQTCRSLSDCISRAICIFTPYSEKETEAEQSKGFYSPGFNTDTNGEGYGLRLKLYRRGDGVGKPDESKNNLGYLSLFIAIEKTNNDEKLDWPFNQTVEFSLLDQSGEGKHIEDALPPDPDSISFSKPDTHINIGMGSPKFTERANIKEPYLVNDTMLIEVTTKTNKGTSTSEQPSKVLPPQTKGTKSHQVTERTCCFPLFFRSTTTTVEKY